jgi:hypothetical protein
MEYLLEESKPLGRALSVVIEALCRGENER